MINISKEEPRYIRVISLLASLDWKGCAMTLGILSALVVGMINSCDALVDKAIQARTQKISYTVLAGKLEAIELRLSAMEGGQKCDSRGIGAIPLGVFLKANRLPAFAVIQARAKADSVSDISIDNFTD